MTRRLINDSGPIVVNFTNIITFCKAMDMKILIIIIIIIIIIPNKCSTEKPKIHLDKGVFTYYI